MVLVKTDKLFLDILDKKHALLDYKGNNIVAKLESAHHFSQKEEEFSMSFIGKNIPEIMLLNILNRKGAFQSIKKYFQHGGKIRIF